MATLRLILGDQLSASISSLEGCHKTQDIILMAEVWDEATYVKHHKKKIAFLFSAMRHFAQSLKKDRYHVEYTKLDDESNTGSIYGEVKRHIKQHSIKNIVVTHPGEYRVLEDMLTWENDFGIPVDIQPDNRFLCTPEAFKHWSENRKQLRMEYFYREMRKQYCILMDGDQPLGGKWNYDADNRKPPKDKLSIPAPYSGHTDKITRDVMVLVAKRFSDHFGDLEPFYFAVTREQALEVLKLFINERLCLFGDYQDAMIEGEPWMYHSHISFYLNCGLLLTLE